MLLLSNTLKTLLESPPDTDLSELAREVHVAMQELKGKTFSPRPWNGGLNATTVLTDAKRWNPHQLTLATALLAAGLEKGYPSWKPAAGTGHTVAASVGKNTWIVREVPRETPKVLQRTAPRPIQTKSLWDLYLLVEGDDPILVKRFSRREDAQAVVACTKKM